MLVFGGCPSPKPKVAQPDLAAQLRMAPPELPTKPAGTDEADAMRVHVIDIGQGLAVMVEFPCGVMLYDTGGEKNERYDAAPALHSYLDKFFASRPDLDKTIELLVLGHPHIDHTRAVESVIERYRVKHVIDNGDDNDDLGGRPQGALHRWIESKEDAVPYYAVRRSEITRRDGLTNATIDPFEGCEAAPTDPVVRALWGGSELPAEMGHNANDDSVALRIDYGSRRCSCPATSRSSAGPR